MPARNPLCKAVLLYSTGLLLGYFFIYSTLSFLLFAALVSALSASLPRLKKIRLRTLLMYALPLLGGVVLINIHSYPRFSPQHVVHYAERFPMTPIDARGTVISTVEERGDYGIFYLNINALKQNSRWSPVEGNIRLSISNSLVHPKYGDRVLLKKLRLRLPHGYWNPGGFDFQSFMARRGIYASGSLWKDASIDILASGEGNHFLALLYSFKERSASAIDRNLPRREAGILKAMVLGQRWGVEPTDRTNFIRSGIAHLLAISGLHVGFVALASYYIIHLLLKGIMLLAIIWKGVAFPARRWAALATILPVTAYAAMVGDRPSAIRAAIMVVTYMGARFFCRDKNLYNALALAALIILIWKPLSILELGFQLSFLAAFFIVHYLHVAGAYPDEERNLARRFIKPSVWKHRILTYLFISLVATLATAPLIAYSFSEVSFNGPLVNMLAIPVSLLLVPAGLLSGLLSLVSESAARPLLDLSFFLTYILREMASFFSQILPFSLKALVPWIPAATAFYFLLAWTINSLRSRHFRTLLAATAISIAFAFAVPYLHSHSDDMLRLTFLDVGEGDAAVVQFPGGKVMVIDTGPAFRKGRDTGEIVLSPYLRSLGIRLIDYLLITHAQIDHAGGAYSLLKYFRVGKVWHNGGKGIEKYLSSKFAYQAAPPQVQQLEVNAEMSSRIIDGVKIDFLNPPTQGAADNHKLSENNRSAVVRLTYRDFSALFTGDIERQTEKILLSNGSNLRSTVLKVPHHGATDAASSPFFSEVHPEVAVISAGKYNRFFHPRPRTLSLLQKLGTAIYRTDRDGAISITSDGKTYSIKTYAQSFKPNDIRRIIK